MARREGGNDRSRRKLGVLWHSWSWGRRGFRRPLLEDLVLLSGCWSTPRRCSAVSFLRWRQEPWISYEALGAVSKYYCGKVTQPVSHFVWKVQETRWRRSAQSHRWRTPALPAPPQVAAAAAAIEVASEQLRKEGRKEGVVQVDESLRFEVGIAVQVAEWPAIYTHIFLYIKVWDREAS